MKKWIHKSIMALVFGLSILAFNGANAWNGHHRGGYYGSGFYGPGFGIYFGPGYYRHRYYGPRCRWVGGYWAYGYYHPARRICRY